MPRRMRTWLSGLVEKSGPHRWTLFNIFLKSRVGWKFLEDEEVSSAFDVFFSGRHVVGLMLSLSSCLFTDMHACMHSFTQHKTSHVRRCKVIKDTRPILATLSSPQSGINRLRS